MDAFTVLCIMLGLIVPICVGLKSGSMERVLLAIDQFSTGLWIVLFAFLWFWYHLLLQRAKRETRELESLTQEHRIVNSADTARPIAVKESEIRSLTNEGSTGLSVVEQGILICAAISGLAKMLLWLTVTSA